ncbi:MAG: Flp family type IVb pilin [Sphingomicrobium sp.]
MKQRRGLHKDRKGAAAAEYALVLAIAGAAITFGALALGTAITDSLDNGSQCVAATASTNADC